MPNASAPQSFIPHEAPVAPKVSGAKGRGIAELVTLISIVLFVASAALAAGVFLYGEYLQSSAASKVDQIERAKAAFDPALIHELTRLDDRMRAAGDVLALHIAPRTLFAMLEQATIATVAFTSLDFNAEDRANMKIKMDGVAASVNSIALQADLFSKGGMITSPIFSDIDRQTDGVHFTLTALLNPEAVNFSQLVGASSAAQTPAPAESSPFNVTAPGGNQASPQATPPEP